MGSAIRLDEDQRRLVEDNIDLARWEARRATRSLLDPDERFAVALVGLCLAAARHDPARTKFVTYAAASIRRRLARANKEVGRMIRIPEYAQNPLGRVGRPNKHLGQAGRMILARREGDPSRIADGSGSPPELAEADEENSRLRGAIDGLPGPIRESILDRFAGLGATASAARQGIDRRAVDRRVARGIQLLRAALAERGAA